MKKILVVSFAFPPLAFPRSIQICKTVNYLAQKGFHVDVLSAEPRNTNFFLDNELAQDIHGRIRVLRVPIPRISIGEKILLKCIEKYFPGIDRHSFTWYLHAKKMINHLSLDTYDFIFSCSQPVLSHLIGLQAKKKSKKIWIAHFSDPWIDNPYHRQNWFSKKLQRKLESDVIHQTDAVIFVCKEMQELVMKKYSRALQSKSHVIPHSFNPELFPRRRPIGIHKKLIISYIGNFYEARNPNIFFQSLQELIREKPFLRKSLEIRLIGMQNNQYAKNAELFGISDIVRCMPQIPYRESLREMSNADILLLIDAQHHVNVFLPSKLIDYIGAKKLIFGLTPAGSPSAKLILRMHGVVVSPSDKKGIKKTLISLHEKFSEKKLLYEIPPFNTTRQYLTTETGEKLIALFTLFEQRNQIK